ncbi:hypothetical protein EXU30_07265 [Shewanella maritima]|uniref:IPT/TIG domain-containing protein n=1 Tax=Shewanella maritima TaxID=2520507 RepID=A0A411PG98_9GAMM|nr:IPT/TIG domain-containing protein [Shewanella maritima]QBF82518.1 hypothetical protein EXU30_07265 [Shewanella maritima]
MKYKYLWLSMLLASSLTLTGCGGELESGDPAFQGDNPSDPTSPSDPSQPTDPVDPVDPEEPIDPIDYVGTWENKDEDADGVLDEFDGFPFVAERQSLDLVEEIEPNDNPSIATEVGFTPPFSVSGAISEKSDNGDIFAFSAEVGDFLTLVLRYQDSKFKPNIYFSDRNGNALNFGVIDIAPNLQTVAINVEVLESGLHHIGINDINFDGRESFTYYAEVFVDQDGDAIEDRKEVALGISTLTHDTDDDIISDTEEFLYSFYSDQVSFDPDDDGIPNWLDSDSDGDGLPDKVEGREDADNDGIGNFVDEDSDGNNILDYQEVGNNIYKPSDSDFDTVADYLDLDDDNDGVLDVYDSNRLVGLTEDDSSLINIPYVIHNNNNVEYIREGDIFELLLEKELSTTQHYLVLERDGLEPINKPINALSGKFQAIAYPGVSRVFVSDGILKTNTRNIKLKSAGSPVISSPGGMLLVEGEEFQLLGTDFSEDMTVTASGTPLPIVSHSATEVTVSILSSLSDGDFQINNLSGQSNTVSYFVTQDTNVELMEVGVVDGVSLIFESILGFEYGVDENNSAQVKRFKSRVTPIDSYLGNSNQGLSQAYLNGYILPEDESFVLDINATVFRFVLDFIGSGKVSNEQLYEFRSAIYNYDEFHELASRLAVELELSVTALDKLSPELSNFIITKSNAIFSKFEASAMPVNSAGKYNISLSPPIIQKSGSANIKPTIVNYGTDHFDYSLEATNFLDNWLPSDPSCPDNSSVNDEQKSKLSYDGCAELQNRTRLYLSTMIIPLGDNGEYDPSSLSTPLRKHIENGWDGNILGPQSGTFLGLEFWSKDQYYNECPYQNCLYQVIAPGVGNPVGPSPFSRVPISDYDRVIYKARQSIAIRTIIDGILLKFFDIILTGVGYEPKGFDPVVITKLIIQYSPKLIEEAEKLYDDENVTDEDIENFVKEVAIEFYKNEVEVLADPANAGKLGPITKTVLQELGVSPQDIATMAAGAALRKWTPFVGQIDAILTGAQVADILVDQVKTIKDMMFVPIKSDFTVTWGLTIVDIEPSIMKAEPIDKPLSIVGTGFGINERWYWFDEEPITYLKDEGASTSEVRIEHDSVSAVGTLLNVTVPGTLLESAVGPISVKVEHRGEIANSPVQIKIGDGLEIARIKADSGQPGDIVTIEGIGFSSLKSRNRVTFAGKNNQRVVASVIRSEPGKLIVAVPNGVVTGGVTVEVDDVVSNALEFTVPYILDVTFGDNGNFNDDIFKLVVDDKVIIDGAEPQRKVGPISIPLTAGMHTVKLVGIRAEDEIGTYYIQFEGNLISVSGDELEGRDLLKDSIKVFYVEVGSTTQPVFSKVNPLKALQYE